MVYLHMGEIKIDFTRMNFSRFWFSTGENEIKFIGAKSVSAMRNLEGVELSRNVCLDEDFGDLNSWNSASVRSKVPVSELSRVFRNKCGSQFDFNCGRVLTGRGLVVGGNLAERGQWPFLVSLHHVETKEHFCGGSLITVKHVITGEDKKHSIIHFLTTMYKLSRSLHSKQVSKQTTTQ